MKLAITILLTGGFVVPSLSFMPLTTIAKTSECIPPTRVNDFKSGKLSIEGLDTKRLTAINKADVVFSGKVISRQELRANRRYPGIRYPIRWTFAVDSIAKGNPSKIQQVIAPQITSPQEFAFKVGIRYQVHTNKSSKTLITNNCAGNEELPATGNAFPIVNDGKGIPRQSIPKGNAPIRLADNSSLPASRLIPKSQILARLKLPPDAKLLSLELMRFGDYEKRNQGGSRFYEVAEGRQVWVIKTFYPEYYHYRMGRVKNATVKGVLDAQTGEGISHGFSGCPLDNFGPSVVFSNENKPQPGQLTKEQILAIVKLPPHAEIQSMWLSAGNTPARQGSYQLIQANRAVWTIKAIYPEYPDNQLSQIKEAIVVMTFDAKSGELLDKTVDCQPVGG